MQDDTMDTQDTTDTLTVSHRKRGKSDAYGDSVSNRPKRIPVSGVRDVLTADGKESGFSYRWVNDTPGRIDTFKAAGYEVVQHRVSVGQKVADTVSNAGYSVHTKHVGDGKNAVLMRTTMEFYNEDQAAKEARTKSLEDTMRSANRSEGQYGAVDIGVGSSK